MVLNCSRAGMWALHPHVADGRGPRARGRGVGDKGARWDVPCASWAWAAMDAEAEQRISVGTGGSYSRAVPWHPPSIPALQRLHRRLGPPICAAILHTSAYRKSSVTSSSPLCLRRGHNPAAMALQFWTEMSREEEASVGYSNSNIYESGRGYRQGDTSERQIVCVYA